MSDHISKSQAEKLAKIAGSKTGKLKKKHIRRLKAEARKDNPYLENSNKVIGINELMKLGLYD